MEAVRCINKGVSVLRWLSIGLVVTLLASIGLPLAVGTSIDVMAASPWTQTTVDDFNTGTTDQTEVVIWDPFDAPEIAGDVILESVTRDQENWGPSQAPNTPKIYGEKYVAQTFTAGMGGAYITITLYVSRHEGGTSLDDLIVELWDTTGSSNEPGTLLSGGSATVSSGNVPEGPDGGAIDVSMALSAPLVSSTMYAIILRQDGGGGGPNDYYKFWYDGDYALGSAWKHSSISSGWGGATGFGGHDGTFIIYISDVPDGKGYLSPGTFTSDEHDAGVTGANWGTMSWSETLYGQTMTMKVRTSNASDMTGATGWASCPPVTSGDDISALSSVTDGHRYIQYRAELATSDSEETPVLHDVTITYVPTPVADLSLTKGVDDDTPDVGANVVFTIS